MCKETSNKKRRKDEFRYNFKKIGTQVYITNILQMRDRNQMNTNEY